MSNYWGLGNNLNSFSAVQPNANNNYQLVKCRAVAGIEEAKAAQIVFDGSLHLFADISNGKLYTKQLNTNGQMVFNIYALEQQPAQTAAPALSQNDIADIVRQSTAELTGKITTLENEFKKLKSELGDK